MTGASVAQAADLVAELIAMTAAGIGLALAAAAVMAGDDKVWSETICARLAELRPDHYRGWDATQLAGALKPYGLVTSQVWGTDETGKGSNKRGFTRADLDRAMSKAAKQPAAGGWRGDPEAS